ncbi:MAG: Ig-like domain-containing protein [Candidatus Thorarchaeota archaeon]
MRRAIFGVISLFFILCLLNNPVVVRETDTVSTSHSTPIEVNQVLSAYGEDPILINHALNPSFEKLESNQVPSDWNTWGYGRAIRNAAFTDKIYSGSYGGYLLSEGTAQWSQTAQWYRSFSSGQIPISGDVFFTMYYYLNSLPDPSLNGYFNLQIATYSSQWRYMNYFLSHSPAYNPGNGSNTAYFLLNSSMYNWHSFSRNITADYESVFGTPPPGQYLSYMQFQLYSPQDPPTYSEVFIDEVSIIDDTSTEELLNGDFEMGDSSYWGSYSDSPSYILPSIDSTDGLRSINVTTKAISQDSSSYSGFGNWWGYPEGLYAESPGSMVIEFDWKYYDSWNGGSQFTDMYVYVQNATDSHSIVFIIGSDMDMFGLMFSNYTWATYIAVDNFGSRGTWEHFSVDMYEIMEALNFTGMTISEVSFEVNLGYRANSSISLLVDDFKLMSYPTFDPGFEQDHYYSSSNPITGWYEFGSINPYTNLTTDSHSGQYAYNMTLFGGSVTSGVQSQAMNLPVDVGLHTDFWWKLDSLSVSSGFVMTYLELDDSRFIYYMLAGPPSYGFSNTSTDVYFTVANYSVTGQWLNLVRDVYQDVQAAFGPGLYNITRVVIYSQTQPTDSLSVLLDDMHFIQDTKAPILLGEDHWPATPMYYESEVVGINTTDMTGSGGSLLYHDGLSWTETPLIPIQDYGSFEYFEATIPALPYGTLVQYYFTLTDSIGNWAQYLNSTLYYSYTVGDDVDPVVAITSHDDGDIVAGYATLAVDASDPGVGSSGIDRVEMWIDGFYIDYDDIAPYEFSGNTRTNPNGTMNIEVRAYDVAGNYASDTVWIDIQNDHQSPELSFITLDPVVPWSGEDVDVSLAVTDQTGVDNVTLYYRTTVIGWQELVMQNSGSLFYTTIPAQTGVDEVEYYIIGYDVFGQNATAGSPTTPLSFSIMIDDVPPYISGLLRNPVAPEYYESVTITVSVTDNRNVESVTLFYRMDSGSWISVPMSLDGGIYIAEIPAADWGVEVDYYIVAVDAGGLEANLGNEVSSEGYIVADTILPILSVTGPSSNNPVRGNVSFYVTGSDSGSGIAAVELYVGGSLVWEGITVPATLEWITTTLPNGNYTVDFVLEDGAGNQMTLSYVYQVANPDVFGSIGEGLSSFMQSFGFIGGFSTFVILIVAVRIFQKRRSGAE